MAVLVKYILSGVTPEIYDNIRERVGWEREIPPGAMFHAVGFNGDTLHEVDVWTTETEMRDYFERRVAPVAATLGVALPEPEVYPVHLMAMVCELLEQNGRSLPAHAAVAS
jgi:hypothetical protein